MKKEADSIVLICNPRAGGRWKQLAGILDSAEAQQVRRVVTDSIEDIGPALVSLSQRVKLVCIYGGDGTIQKILSSTFQNLGDTSPPVCLVGGGTMNVTARWCGWTASPEKNFRRVVHDYLTDKLVTREVPLLEIRQGGRTEYGFTFGAGSVIRVLDAYERSEKGGRAAIQIASKAVLSAWTRFFPTFRGLLEPIRAEILADGVPLAADRFTVVFCNTTGHVERGIRPFTRARERETFYLLAYSSSPGEIAALFPLLANGIVPIDPKSLLRPVSVWKQMALAYLGQGSLPTDPRYVNRIAREVVFRSGERVFTIDGEIFESSGEPLTVRLGPTLRLAIRRLRR